MLIDGDAFVPRDNPAPGVLVAAVSAGRMRIVIAVPGAGMRPVILSRASPVVLNHPAETECVGGPRRSFHDKIIINSIKPQGVIADLAGC